MPVGVVAMKPVAANVEDEREMVHRERLSIEQFRAILSEMLVDPQKKPPG